MKINLKHLPDRINSVYLEQILPNSGASGTWWRCVLMNTPKTFEAVGVNKDATKAFNEAIHNYVTHNYSQINY